MTFRSSHPNYCTNCLGWGGFSSPGDRVPYGSTSAQLPDDWTPCPVCVDDNLCPWCGSPIHEVLDSPFRWHLECTVCDWRDDRPEGEEPEPDEPDYGPEDL